MAINFDQYKRDYMQKAENQIKVKDYKVQNPILDEKGKVIMFDAGTSMHWHGEDGLRAEDRGTILGAVATAQGTVDAAVIEANSLLMSSAMEADAAVSSALIDAEVRMQETSDLLEGTKYQADTDKEIAMMEREVELEKLEVERDKIELEKYRIDNVGVRQADAAFQSATADLVEAEGEADRDRAKAQKYLYNPAGSANWLS